jgi:two-component system chemotaxis response regulator CheB
VLPGERKSMKASGPIRVLVVEDSPTIRHYLKTIIDDTPQLQVVGTARDGVEAVHLIAEIKPDVVSMDVQMPVLDGLEATRQIMHQHPTPVVIVSGLVDREIDLSFRALQAGALAVVPKPPSRDDSRFEAHTRQLTNTLQAMAGVRVIRRWASAYEVNPPKDEKRFDTTHTLRPTPEIIAVAASAGGPSALATLLGGFQSQLSIPMVVVQHMPGEFLVGLARWMRKFTDLNVQIAKDGETLEPGVVYFAPGNHHLRVVRNGTTFCAQVDAEAHGHRYQPSADVLFESVATATGERGVGIVLTGMGDDGAYGLGVMRGAGARTFAQDEESCVVFGMPAAAIERGAAERVMSAAQIASTLRKLV